MNRIDGRGSGGGNCRTMRCIVGVAVYHEAWCFVKCFQKDGLSRFGKIMVPPDLRGAKKDARSPWTWNRGIMRTVRSLSVSW